MRIMWTAVLLVPSLYNAGIFAEHCDQPENRIYLGSALDQRPIAATTWNLTAYPQAACGGDPSPFNGSSSSGCEPLDNDDTPELSYRYWGEGTWKVCLFSALGCSPSSFLEQDLGDKNMTCTPTEAALSFAIVQRLVDCRVLR